MNLKELIKETENDLYVIKNSPSQFSSNQAQIRLSVRKQTVEAINNAEFGCSSQTDTKLWWKLKKLLNVK